MADTRIDPDSTPVREPNAGGYTPKVTWEDLKAAGKIPGNSAPVDGKCNSLLKDSIERWGEERFCGDVAGKRTSHPGIGPCFRHLGATESAAKAAGKEQARRELKSLSERLGKPTPLGDPVQEMIGLAAEVLEFKAAIREMLDTLPSLDLYDAQGISRAQALVTMFQETQRDSLQVLNAIQRLGLAEREVALKEKQAELVANVLLALILHPSLGLTDDKITWARGFIGEKMKELAPAFEARDNEQVLMDLEAIEDE